MFGSCPAAIQRLSSVGSMPSKPRITRRCEKRDGEVCRAHALAHRTAATRTMRPRRGKRIWEGLYGHESGERLWAEPSAPYRPWSRLARKDSTWYFWTLRL